MRHDGETKADMYRRFGKGDEVPEQQEVPDCGAHILQWFFELSNRRQPSMGGVSPLTFSDIAAWRDILGIEVLPGEVQMILALDVAYRKAVNDTHQKSKSKPQECPPTKGFFKA